MLDITSEDPVPILDLLLKAFKDRAKDFKDQNIRMDFTLSKVDKLVELVHLKTEENDSDVTFLREFFQRDVEVFIYIFPIVGGVLTHKFVLIKCTLRIKTI